MNRVVGAALLLLAVGGAFLGFSWMPSAWSYALLPVSLLLGSAGSLLVTKDARVGHRPARVAETEFLPTPEPHSNVRTIQP